MMSGRDNAVRVALAAIALPVEDRVIVIDALLGLGDHFERALADNPDLQVVRPLSEILADIEFGVPLQPDETALVERLAERIPPRPVRSFLDERDDLIRSIVVRFAPAGATSTSRRAAWLEERVERLVAGADWRRDRNSVLCPYADSLRAHLWRLAQFGPLPRDRKLREIISGS